MANDIKKFMNGEDDNKIKSQVFNNMKKASEELNFEKASEYKKILDAIDHIQEKQSITLNNHSSFDVIATSYRENYFALSILTYRKGLLLGKNVFVNEQEGEDNEEQVLSMIFQYYQKHEIPKEILIGNKKYQESLINILQTKVNIPSRGIKKEMLLIALENAKNGIDEHFLSSRLNDDNLKLLEELGEILHIKTPLRIELFDNSHLQGSSPIGAMVVFINGEKAPSMYRKFNITYSDGKDDLKSMYEVIFRRYSRLKKENQSYPDLILVDGGLNKY